LFSPKHFLFFLAFSFPIQISRSLEPYNLTFNDKGIPELGFAKRVPKKFIEGYIEFRKERRQHRGLPIMYRSSSNNLGKEGNSGMMDNNNNSYSSHNGNGIDNNKTGMLKDSTRSNSSTTLFDSEYDTESKTDE